MEVAQQTLLNFGGVDFVNVNVHLENPMPRENQHPVDMNILPKVFFPTDRPKEFTVIIEIKLGSKGFFTISITAFGFFTLPEFVGDIRSQKAFINVNAPAIMFPYVRSFISTLTANLGVNFLPVIVPPHFFQGDLQEHIESSNNAVQVPTIESIQENRSQ